MQAGVFRLSAGFRHNGLGLTGQQQRSAIQHIDAAGQGGNRGNLRLRVFLYMSVPADGCFVADQEVRTQQTAVRRDRVSGREAEDIAGNERGIRHRQEASAAAHRSRHRDAVLRGRQNAGGGRLGRTAAQGTEQDAKQR